MDPSCKNSFPVNRFRFWWGSARWPKQRQTFPKHCDALTYSLALLIAQAPVCVGSLQAAWYTQLSPSKLSLYSLSSFQAVNVFTLPFFLSMLHFHTIPSSILNRSSPLLLSLFHCLFFLPSFCSLTALNSTCILTKHSLLLTASSSVMCPSLSFLLSDNTPSLLQTLPCPPHFFLDHSVYWEGADILSLFTWLSV